MSTTDDKPNARRKRIAQAAAVFSSGPLATVSVEAPTLPDPEQPAEAPAPADQGDDQVASVAETVTNQTADAGQAGAERAQAMFGDMAGRAKSSFERGTRMVEEMNDFAKGNVEALVASGRVAAKGAEGLFQEAADYGRKHFEKLSGSMQGFASVKSPTELFQMQSELAKSSFESAVSESAKLTEAYVKYVSDVFEPISTRFAVAADKIKTVAR